MENIWTYLTRIFKHDSCVMFCWCNLIIYFFIATWNGCLTAAGLRRTMHFSLVSDRWTELLDATGSSGVIRGHPGSSEFIRGHMCFAGNSWAYVYMASLCQANFGARLKELEASICKANHSSMRKCIRTPLIWSNTLYHILEKSRKPWICAMHFAY